MAYIIIFRTSVCLIIVELSRIFLTEHVGPLYIFDHCLEKTIMQGMVAGERSRGKPRQRWEKYITCTFGTMAAAEWRRTDIDFAETSGQRRPDEDRPLFNEKKIGQPVVRDLLHCFF